MEYFLLFITVIFVSLQGVTQKEYNKKCGEGPSIFVAFSSFAAICVFLVTGGKLDLSLSLMPYSIGFCIAYITASRFHIKALSVGALSLTELVISYSLMLPTLYGLIFLREEMSVFFIPGVAFLLFSLYFINKTGERSTDKLTFKWLLYVSLAFVGNGFCSILQNMQQKKFDGNYKSEFMIIALILVCILSFFFAFTVEKKTLTRSAVKKAVSLGIVCGIMNGVVNFSVMLLFSLVKASVMFPIISSGGIVVSFFIATFVYKEKMSKSKYIGVALGVISIVLLNL